MSSRVAHALLFMDIRDLLLAYRLKNDRPRYFFDFRGGNFCSLRKIRLKRGHMNINARIT